MTYCLALRLDAGLVFLSDTRTNAGLDNIAIYRKMFVFEKPGDRIVAVDGQPTPDYPTLTEVAGGLPAAPLFDYDVERDGQTLTIPVELR